MDFCADQWSGKLILRFWTLAQFLCIVLLPSLYIIDQSWEKGKYSPAPPWICATISFQ